MNIAETGTSNISASACVPNSSLVCPARPNLIRQIGINLQRFARMHLDTKRSKRLDVYVADASREIRDEKVRVMLAGEIKTLNVFRIPLDHLFYNIRNAVFKINRSESLRGGADKVHVANPVDARVINFKTARVPEEDEMRIELEGEPDQNLFRPDAPVLFAIGFSKRQIICGIAGPVAFAVGSALTAAEHSCFLTKFLGEILKLIGLGLLFVAFGRKVT